MRPLVALLAAALALLLPASAGAEERILHFLSDVAVQRDGSLAVAETIRLRSEGVQIQRGILRDFPTRYQKNGRTMRVGFDVESVTRDGRPEPYSVDSIDNGKRIRIGDADVALDPGEHEYVIRYRTTKQLGFFADYDELYWNATGTGWTFPIDVAEARVTLPEPVQLGQRAVYTGGEGSTERAAQVVSEQPGEILFRTTAPLGPYQGLTVAVAWPKGIVAAPAPRSATSLWLQENLPPGIAILALLGIFYYYFHAWRRVGRGPGAGTIVPLFSPPDDMSPAAIRYVSEMGSFDNRTFAAAIVDLGVRGRIRLEEGEKRLIGKPKTWIEKTGDASGLPAPEAAMHSRLFAGADRLLMDDDNHRIFGSAKNGLSEGLASAYDKDLFRRNYAWSLAGIGLLFLALWLTAMALVATDPDLPDRGTAITTALLSAALAAAAAAVARFGGRSSGWKKGLGIVAAILLAFGSFMLMIATIGIAAENGRILPLAIPFIAVPLILSAFWWMPAPTRKGRALMDRVAGFQRYLSITEEERLATMHPPEKTPLLFERYLPHAIALEVENAWARRFTTVLAAAAAAGHAQQMGWYSGHRNPWDDTDGFVDRIGSSLSNTVASASTAPGSSSGSGGGGSSGGGGGGGGGSGW